MKKEPQQSRYADIVIQCQQMKNGMTAEDLRADLEALLLKSQIKEYAYILHDKDTLEDGTPKGNHIHLVALYAVDKVKRKSEVLNEMTDLLSDYVEKSAISVDLFRHVLLERKLKYLSHSNQEDIEAKKYPYFVGEIKASNYLKAKIDSTPFGDNLFQKIYDLIKEGCTDLEIMAEIGMDDYRQYRFNIIDMRRCLCLREKTTAKERAFDKIMDWYRDNRRQNVSELLDMLEKINVTI